MPLILILLLLSSRTYNVTPSETPNSFFDIYSSRNMHDVLAANITF